MDKARVPNNATLYIVFGLLLYILGMAGLVLSFRTLLPSLLIAALCLIWGIWTRRSLTLLLVDVWLLAYLYIFLSEYVLARDEILWLFGSTITFLSEGFLVASFGATLIGYGLVSYRTREKPAPASRQVIPRARQGKQNAPPIRDLAVENAPKAHVASFSTRETCPLPITAFIVILALACLYYVTQVMTWEQLLFVGRSQRTSSADLGLFWSLIETSVVMFPAVVLFLWRRYELPLPLKLLLLPVAGVAILAVIASGTRYLLGFQLTSVLFLLISGAKPRSRQWIMVSLLLILLLTGPQVMLNTRGAGVGNVGLAESVGEVLQPETYLSSEGILRINALIHLGRAYPIRDRPPENLFIAYWWVPREWWPDKPTMAGYWVIRELSGDRGFSEGYSASGGFAMPALLDFGPIAGSAFSLLYGMLIGGFEIFVRRQRDVQRPTAILAGAMYFAVFFMMRSLHTSLIYLMIAGIVSVVPLIVLMRYTASGKPVRVHTLAIGPAERVHKSLERQ